jgi:large subunit ribosomal protein L12
VDSVRIKALVASLAEVDIDEAIKSSQAQIPVMAPPAQAAAPEEKKKEGKKEKKEKEEKKEEAALEGLGALFG